MIERHFSRRICREHRLHCGFALDGQGTAKKASESRAVFP
jgi:hypothetical protein